MNILEGIISGLAAGFLMGLLSHAGFTVGLFKSSLFIIDGTFVQQRLGQEYEARKVLLSGIPVHLLTSVSFGLGYVMLIRFLNLDLLNGWLIAVYTVFLWFSMLFVALPVAGQGLFGKNLGSLTWLEQMVLHMVFGIGLWSVLYALHW